ncbi:MAG: DUF6088 family protein [Planctomycetaceae bacterium]
MPAAGRVRRWSGGSAPRHGGSHRPVGREAARHTAPDTPREEGLPARHGDGPTRTVHIGAATIQLRRTTPKNMETAGRLSGMVIQAFRELGRDNITPERIAHLRRTIPAPKRRELLADLRLAPTWMHPLFRSLAAADPTPSADVRGPPPPPNRRPESPRRELENRPKTLIFHILENGI